MNLGKNTSADNLPCSFVISVRPATSRPTSSCPRCITWRPPRGWRSRLRSSRFHGATGRQKTGANTCARRSRARSRPTRHAGARTPHRALQLSQGDLTTSRPTARWPSGGRPNRRVRARCSIWQSSRGIRAVIQNLEAAGLNKPRGLSRVVIEKLLAKTSNRADAQSPAASAFRRGAGLPHRSLSRQGDVQNLLVSVLPTR